MEDENGKVGAPSKATSQGLKSKSAAQRAALLLNRPKKKGLQRRFNLETPCFEQGFRDILGILVPASPFPQTGGSNELVRAEFELLHNLLEGGHCGYNRPNGLRLAPIRISTTLCHRFGVLKKGELDALPRVLVGTPIRPEVTL